MGELHTLGAMEEKVEQAEPAEQVERVFGAAVEGQAQSARFRQRELSQLHRALGEATPHLQEAMKRDDRASSSEVDIQYALALEHVAACLVECDLAGALRAEYTVARSENAPASRRPFGVAYIEPSSYNLVFSCVTAVAAAIAGGNCVILELPRTPSATSGRLRRVLADALSPDTFIVVDKPVDVARLAGRCVRLVQTPPTPARDLGAAASVLAVPDTRTLAIVDRYADMRSAATALLRARFSFGGRSPIAPDLVLVNEFRVKEFYAAVAEEASQYLASRVELDGAIDPWATARARESRISTHELDRAGAETIMSGSRGSVVRVSERASPILKKAIHEPLLVIHAVKSLDDAIDLADPATADGPLAALHVFGSPEVAKYASQFIHSRLTCVNDIPVELLVAPLTPIGFATHVASPYRTDMFTMPSPAYVRFGEDSAALAATVDRNVEAEAARLRKQAQMRDTTVKQPPGRAIGYFEQGLLVGASIAVSAVIAGSVVLWRYGVPVVQKLRLRA